MLPLKLVFIWHQHQPYYKSGSEFLLPWVRLHAQKDYFDIPNILHEFPGIRQTFNLVPSLALQLSQYSSGDAMDKAQRLTLKPADDLNTDDKRYILKAFFMLHVENLLKPHPRYRELWERADNKDRALTEFTVQDWRDLQTWYTLAWFGFYSSKQEVVKRLIEKGKNFTENEKRVAAAEAMKVVNRVIDEYKTLNNLDQIEVSCSPFYHPILPLLIDTGSALEAMPQLGDSVRSLFSAPDDAELQVQKAREQYRNYFGSEPAGIWPSEGSISDATLDLLIRNGFSWVASDETVLEKSVGPGFRPTEKFFPRKYKNHNGEISILFRDHYLSDRIGFVYSAWNEKDAAIDFVKNLSDIKREIVHIHGENSLKNAVVSVILDGENCWEYYRENGIPFLRELFRILQNSPHFKTVTASEAVVDAQNDYLPDIRKIRAGSWINADFKIWIGDDEDRRAWKMLADARMKLQERRHKINDEKFRAAMEEIYIAEGSDWFWWYGPEHISDNNPDFDYLFRSHLLKVYEIIGEKAPDELNIPVGNAINYEISALPEAKLERIDLIDFDWKKFWQHAGFYDAAKAQSSMHQTGEFLNKVTFGNNEDYILFGFETAGFPENVFLTIEIDSPKVFAFQITANGIEKTKGISCKFIYFRSDYSVLAINKSNFENISDVKFTVKTMNNALEISYPKVGKLEFGIL